MANPRDLAEQAFALLQDALRDSEARALDLDEQLKRKRAPKTKLEEQLDVLTHRLEKVESERSHWEQQAGHLEEVAEAERVKVAQLKKKLEIAESGPEKLTKKEVNYWRERAESFDTETQEYKTRLASLQRELMGRDAQIAELQNSPQLAVATPAPAAAEPDEVADELRHQIQQRDEWLAELRAELHDLRTQATGTPEPPLETLAEIETLRHQVTSLERALAEAHNTRAAAQADFNRASQDVAARDRAVREAGAAAEHAQGLVRERDHRLVELSAQFEQLRNESHQREHQIRAESAEHADQIASLSRELMEVRSRADQDRQAAADASVEIENARSARAAAEQRAAAAEAGLDEARAAHTAAEQRIATTEEALARAEHAVLERSQQHTETTAAIQRLEREVAQREQELAARGEQLRDLGQRLADRELHFNALSGDLEHAKATVAANDREISSLRDTLQATNAELEHARAAVAANDREVSSLRETLQAAHGDLEHAKATVSANSRELSSLRETLQAATRDLQEARGQVLDAEATSADARRDAEALASELAAAKEQLNSLNAAHAETRRQADAFADEVAAAREQIAGLEAELKEEKDNAENLGELANERREHMTKLQEQVEEAEERYAEADWRLGKALYFEKLVKRRKGLIAKLLEALRAKMKANVALKAGLDGLRTYKASAEANQQKMLQRLDKMKAQLTEAEETIKKHQGATHTKEELARVESRATDLEMRLNTQAEIIQSLEAELKTTRLAHHTNDNDASQQIEQLRAELETKSKIITKLQEDADDQQRKLGKLRGSESETMRLKAMTEKDRSEIDTLQREIAQLREALARQSAAAAASGSDHPELAAMLKEREQTVTRLMATVKEHEATIKKLNESAEGWKRKYQFLAADEPDAYKSAAEQ
jgi:chromosome segregation ATPase